MAIVNNHFKQAGLAGILQQASAWNSSGGRINIYSTGVAKPTNLYATPFSTSTYSAYRMLTYTLTSGTFIQDGATIRFNTVPSAVAASLTGTASWAALIDISSGLPNYTVVGDVTLSTGNGMVYLPTLNIVSGTSYAILECSFTIS
jgi:hypothetical protein